MIGYWKKYIEIKCLEIQILSMWELLQLFAFHIYAGYTSIAEVCVHIKLFKILFWIAYHLHIDYNVKPVCLVELKQYTPKITFHLEHQPAFKTSVCFPIPREIAKAWGTIAVHH